MPRQGEQNGPIQLIPPGLLGFLQLKVGGLNPENLSTNLQATLELFEWYMQARLEHSSSSISRTVNTAGGAGSFVPFLVPANALVVPDKEFWWVESFTILALLGAAADTTSFQCGWQSATLGAPSFYSVGPTETATGSATSNVEAFARSDRPFFCPPGAQLGIMNRQTVSAAGVQFFPYVRFARLPI